MKIEKTFYIHFNHKGWHADGRYHLPSDPEAYELSTKEEAPWGRVAVGPVNLVFEVPDFDVNALQVAAKREELQQLSADFERRRTEIMREIQELLALPAPQADGSEWEVV